MNPEWLVKLLGIGASLSISERNEGEISTRLHQAEILAQGYVRLQNKPLFLRPGLRLGYQYSPYPDDPKSVKIEENTWNGTAEIGLIYEGVVIPSVSWQTALLSRDLRLVTAESLARSERSNPPKEWLFSNAIVFGVGLPVASGQLVLEPFYKTIWISGDDRPGGQWGLDATWALRWND